MTTAHALTPVPSLPFGIGEARSHGPLTVIPLFPYAEPGAAFIGLDEAVAAGLRITEIGAEGVVQRLAAVNPLTVDVLLYEAEELVGAKQNRILGQSVLVAAGAKVELPATCVERGRWSRRTERLAPAPRAAYPTMRRAQRAGQGAVWAEISAKQERLEVHSPTEAAEAMYELHHRSLEEFVHALPRLDGQSGVLAGIGGRLVCLDYVSRSDVFAGLYLKLLRGYALDAIEAPADRQVSEQDVVAFLVGLDRAGRVPRPAVGLGVASELAGTVVGRELEVDGEVVALSAFPAR